MRRWTFAHFGGQSEAQAKAMHMESMRAWWTKFPIKIPTPESILDPVTQSWVSYTLKELIPEMGWEFGPDPSGGHRLVLSAEGQAHVQPLIDDMVGLAPQLPGWSFYAYRQPIPDADLELYLRTRAGLCPTICSVETSIGPTQFVDITVKLGHRPVPSDQMEEAGFILVESIVGEQLMEEWLGHIQFTVASMLRSAFTGRLDSAEFLSRIESAVSESRSERLETTRANSEDWNGTILSATPHSAEDYSGKADLVSAKTIDVGLFQATNTDRFHSDRYSKHGELFCYLKLDEEGGLDDGAALRRAELENSLETALRAAGTGTVLGGGQGLRYCYIDLALSNIEIGIQVAVDWMRSRDSSKRAWLLFCDARFANEWVGAYEDSPPPP